MLLLSLVQLTDVAVVGGVISALVSFASTGVFYFVAIFVARIVVCLALGQLLVRATVGDDGSQRLVLISLFVGIFFLAVTASLPAIGWIINALTLALGLGAIVILAQSNLRTIYEARVMPARYISRHSSARMLPRQTPTPQFPPPMIDDTPPPPGMDNLPPGFTWWDDG